jgi:para-nitrobenzyl esterase
MLRHVALLLGMMLPMAASAGPVITIGDGKLQGIPDNNAAIFRGIPYAAPPVGNLRWRPPQPAVKWAGVRDATQFAPACPQSPNSPVMMVGPVGASSEDCLTLNVWKPAAAQDGAKLPVMVWIHGGGFFTGSGSEQQFDGAPYVARGTILVTVNYRLGRLGFFAHPALDAENPSELHGNFGLMDQIAALKWVRSNIASFGGDPGNVTVFGESAGGISILALMTSPLAQGLFHKAIVESGVFPQPLRAIATDMPERPSAETLGKAFAASLGISGAGEAAALRALPVEKVAPAMPVGADELASIQATSAPMIDGVMIVENIADSIALQHQAKLPLIIGNNSFEAEVWLFLPGGKMGTVPIMPVDLEKILGRRVPAGDRAVAQYAERMGVDKANVGPEIASEIVSTATRFIAGRASSGSPTYLYQFDTVPTPLRGITPGAPHGAEVPYIFGTLSKLRNVASRTTDADHALSGTMIDYWASFARDGNPNGPNRPEWPAYHEFGDSKMLVVTDSGPVVRTDDAPPLQTLIQQHPKGLFADSPK